MENSIDNLKSYVQTVKPVITRQLAAIPSGMDVVVVRGLSLSTLLMALASICVIFTMTIHFRTDSVVSLSAQINHMYKPLPEFVVKVKR